MAEIEHNEYRCLTRKAISELMRDYFSLPHWMVEGEPVLELFHGEDYVWISRHGWDAWLKRDTYEDMPLRILATETPAPTESE